MQQSKKRKKSLSNFEKKRKNVKKRKSNKCPAGGKQVLRLNEVTYRPS